MATKMKLKSTQEKIQYLSSINQVIREEGISEKEAYFKYSHKIFEAKDAQSSIRQRIILAREELGITEDLVSIEYVPKTGKNKVNCMNNFIKETNVGFCLVKWYRWKYWWCFI